MRSLVVSSLFTVLLVQLPGQQVLGTRYGPALAGQTGMLLAPAGDMTGDLVPDLLVSSPSVGLGLVQIVSGATRQVARSIPNTVSGYFGGSGGVLISTSDMDLDGVRDLVVSRGSTLVAYSGATGAVLWETIGLTCVRAAAVGDLDGDGRCDLAVLASFSGWMRLMTLRGSNGSPIQSSANLGIQSDAFIAIGDITGDQIPEVASANAGSIQVFSLVPPALTHTIPVGAARLAAADFDGDGRNEIVASGHTIVSATSGAVLRTFPPPANGFFCIVGDLNADGVPDLALRVNPGTVGDGIDFYSGATALLLSRWRGTRFFRCEDIASAGDVNGDGYGDVLIGDTQASPTGQPNDSTGAWQILSGKVLATISSQPVNCAQGPFLPTLGITRPVLGSMATIEGRDSPAGTVGFLVLSPEPIYPTNLGVVGCDLWYDLGRSVLLYQPTTPHWQLGVPIPLAPQLAGYAIALQAFYAPTLGPLGLDLSNGVFARIGF
jgi:hypothetical protein